MAPGADKMAYFAVLIGAHIVARGAAVAADQFGWHARRERIRIKGTAFYPC